MAAALEKEQLQENLLTLHNKLEQQLTVIADLRVALACFLRRSQELAARRIAAVCNSMDDKRPKIIVEKSTVPVKTADAMARVMAASCAGTDFQVLSNPEMRQRYDQFGMAGVKQGAGGGPGMQDFGFPVSSLA